MEDMKRQHFDVGDRAFQNKTDSYGGDDYLLLRNIMTIIDKKVSEPEKKEVWLRLDDGKDSMKRVRWV